MKKTLQLILFIATVGGAYAQQSPTDMAAQETAAAGLTSAATSPTYATPWATYQAYYPALTGGHSQNMLACMTPAAIQDMTGGGTSLTTTQSNALDTKWQAAGFTGFTLYSFNFTTNPTHPKITFVYTCTQNSVPIKEQIVLTFTDGSTGWLVSAVDSQEQ